MPPLASLSTDKGKEIKTVYLMKLETACDDLQKDKLTTAIKTIRVYICTHLIDAPRSCFGGGSLILSGTTGLRSNHKLMNIISKEGRSLSLLFRDPETCLTCLKIDISDTRDMRLRPILSWPPTL